MLGKFKSLAKLKYLRGTPADIFGYTTERRAERELIKEYQALVKSIGADLSPANHALASTITQLPDQIRGYGHVKAKAIDEYHRKLAELQSSWPAGLAATNVA